MSGIRGPAGGRINSARSRKLNAPAPSHPMTRNNITRPHGNMLDLSTPTPHSGILGIPAPTPRNSMLDIPTRHNHLRTRGQLTPFPIYSTTRDVREGRRRCAYVSPHHSSAKQSLRKNGASVQVGINYTGSSKPLNGCVNDAHNIRQFLIKHWKFKSQDIMVLTDDSRDPRRLPTKTNMLNAMKWLVKDAKAHDSLFFHYSGHGGRLPDQKGDEVDGYDDVIFPVDYEQKGVGIINDDVLNELLVHPIPDGCRLTALFDSCHSSSVLDLVYLYHSNGLLKNSPVSESYRKSKGSPGDVICFSGCEDNQTSADTVEGGLAVGAMSWAFIQCLNANPKQSYQQLLKNIRTLLRKHFSQRPQLSSSHRINIRKGFIL
ncbi:caspase domain-containing protein [Thelephora terrestris]|uniref:Caspase domain-containing protein n=1 Tax=Thelephora terrestris TaxID=56493 RepID=A0A9P6L6M5_9AGAM|nr:caspase domain-containing protein [Thelephora terrestris]